MFEECFVNYEDDDYYISEVQVICTTEVLTCVECGEVIPIGAKCEWWHNQIEPNGPLGDEYTCESCLRIRDSLFRGAILVGSMWEQIHEHYCGAEEDDDGVEWDICICPDGHFEKAGE